MTHFTVSKLANGWLVSGNLGANGGFYLKDLSELLSAIVAIDAEEAEQRKKWEKEKGMQLSALQDSPQFARSFL